MVWLQNREYLGVSAELGELIEDQDNGRQDLRHLCGRSKVEYQDVLADLCCLCYMKVNANTIPMHLQ